MSIINKHIEIVSSTVPGLSSMGRESREAIYNVLTKYYSKVGITIVNTLTDLEALVASQPDLVFLGMKYLPSDPYDLRGPNKVWLTTYFEQNDIAYTGSSQAAHRSELDKVLAKQRLLEVGLETSPFYVARQNQPNAQHIALSFPLFVKPTDRGGGQGIDSGSVVRNRVALKTRIDNIATNMGADSLVEQYLPGREFSAAILKNEFSDEFIVMPVELVTVADENGVSMLSNEVKTSNTEVVLKITDKTLHANVCALALAAFHALGARDYGRIDIRLDEFGEPHFLEANLLPSLISNYGSFPKACLLNLKLDYEPMILTIVRLALSRQRDDVSSEQKNEPARLLVPVSEVFI